MKVEEYCKREVISIGPDADLGEAAKLMRERHVGFLVVIDADSPSKRAPVGVITDRDIVVQVVAQGLNHICGSIHNEQGIERRVRRGEQYDGDANSDLNRRHPSH